MERKGYGCLLASMALQQVAQMHLWLLPSQVSASHLLHKSSSIGIGLSSGCALNNTADLPEAGEKKKKGDMASCCEYLAILESRIFPVAKNVLVCLRSSEWDSSVPFPRRCPHCRAAQPCSCAVPLCHCTVSCSVSRVRVQDRQRTD